MGGPPTTRPGWKKVLVVWEVKHKVSRVHPTPVSCEVVPMHLFPSAPAPRLLVSDPGVSVSVSKKRGAPVESLPVPRKKVCSPLFLGHQH